MDLAQAKKIQRREWLIENNSKELKQIRVDNFNFLENTSLENMKFRISSFRMGNLSLPQFIPKQLLSFYPLSYFNDKEPTFTPLIVLSTTQIPTNIDYIVGIRSSTYNAFAYLDFTSVFSEKPNQIPQSNTTQSYNYYTNPYFFVFDTAKFCDCLQLTINNVIATTAVVANACQIRKTNNSYELLVLKSVADWFDFQFSDSLKELFAFKNVESPNSTNMFSIIFNQNTVTVNGQPYVQVFSIGISSLWTPYDKILFKTNAPITKIALYDETSYAVKSYDNVILDFKINSIPFDYYTSEFNADDNWCSLFNTNIGGSLFISCNLRLRYTNELVPYTIKNNEKFEFSSEEYTHY